MDKGALDRWITREDPRMGWAECVVCSDPVDPYDGVLYKGDPAHEACRDEAEYEEASPPPIDVTYRLELTAMQPTMECRSPDCDEHYVVRWDGAWVKAFHNERDARVLAEGMRERIASR